MKFWPKKWRCINRRQAGLSAQSCKLETKASAEGWFNACLLLLTLIFHHYVLTAVCALEILWSFAGSTMCKFVVPCMCSVIYQWLAFIIIHTQMQRISVFPKHLKFLVWFSLCKHLHTIVLKDNWYMRPTVFIPEYCRPPSRNTHAAEGGTLLGNWGDLFKNQQQKEDLSRRSFPTDFSSMEWDEEMNSENMPQKTLDS